MPAAATSSPVRATHARIAESVRLKRPGSDASGLGRDLRLAGMAGALENVPKLAIGSVAA